MQDEPAPRIKGSDRPGLPRAVGFGPGSLLRIRQFFQPRSRDEHDHPGARERERERLPRKIRRWTRWRITESIPEEEEEEEEGEAGMATSKRATGVFLFYRPGGDGDDVTAECRAWANLSGAAAVPP